MSVFILVPQCKNNQTVSGLYEVWTVLASFVSIALVDRPISKWTTWTNIDSWYLVNTSFFNHCLLNNEDKSYYYTNIQISQEIIRAHIAFKLYEVNIQLRKAKRKLTWKLHLIAELVTFKSCKPRTSLQAKRQLSISLS